jgi:putative cell wall-binding protein
VTASVAPGSYSTSPATDLGCKYQWYNPGGTVPTTSRLAGVDRYGTAIAISRASFPTSGVPTVYLATGDDFADALSAAPAAAAQGGPLLLTSASALPAATLTEIKRLKPAHIVVVGGPGVIPDSQLSALTAATGITPHRIYGADRYLTAQAVASTVFPKATTAFVASGLNYPDAISASAAAGAAKAPIILVKGTSTVADAQADAFFAKATTIKTVRLIGGTGAVSTAVSLGIQRTGKVGTRVAGADRYATSDAVAHTFFPKAASTYYATGLDFADALTGSVAAAQAKSPLVLTRLECLPADQAQLLLASGASSAVLLGGEGALSAQVAKLGICQQDQLARAAAAK